MTTAIVPQFAESKQEIRRALCGTRSSKAVLDVLQPEELGGAALALPDLFPILECLGRHCVALPIAQSIVARALWARKPLCRLEW